MFQATETHADRGATGSLSATVTPPAAYARINGAAVSGG